MAINDNRAVGYLVQADDWNEIADAINRCAPPVRDSVSSLDGNGSIVLVTGEETDLDLDAGGGGGSVDVNGITVPAENPWPMYLVVVSNNTVVLKHNDSSEPTPAKRFFMADGADRNLTFGAGAVLRYRVTSVGSRWVVLATS